MHRFVPFRRLALAGGQPVYDLFPASVICTFSVVALFLSTPPVRGSDFCAIWPPSPVANRSFERLSPSVFPSLRQGDPRGELFYTDLQPRREPKAIIE